MIKLYVLVLVLKLGTGTQRITYSSTAENEEYAL